MKDISVGGGMAPVILNLVTTLNILLLLPIEYQASWAPENIWRI
jgi:hypothetical protein